MEDVSGLYGVRVLVAVTLDPQVEDSEQRPLVRRLERRPIVQEQRTLVRTRDEVLFDVADSPVPEAELVVEP